VIVGQDVGKVPGFLNPGCAIQEFWKSCFGGAPGDPIFHVSHRQAQKVCVKPEVYVKRMSNLAEINKLQKSLPPQLTGLPHLPQCRVSAWKR
jgi:hypothetical protein